MVVSNTRVLVSQTILECQYKISSNWLIKMPTNFHYEIFQIDNAKSHVQYDMSIQIEFGFRENCRGITIMRWALLLQQYQRKMVCQAKTLIDG